MTSRYASTSIAVQPRGPVAEMRTMHEVLPMQPQCSELDRLSDWRESSSESLCVAIPRREAREASKVHGQGLLGYTDKVPMKRVESLQFMLRGEAFDL